MATTICKPSAEDFKRHFEIFKLDDQNNMDGDDIADKIPYLKASEYHQKWLKIQEDHRAKMIALERRQSNLQNGGDEEPLNSEDLYLLNLKGEDEQMYLLDKIFVETGEDVEDMFIAFKLHKLM
mgnify:CR=1 FL=1|jgi:hypothetical protein